MNRLFAALLAICAWSVSPLNFGFSAEPVPNVIVFLADDLGYGNRQIWMPSLSKESS
jgi:hypothetical protein